VPLPEPHAELRQFVDWERVSATVATAGVPLFGLACALFLYAIG